MSIYFKRLILNKCKCLADLSIQSINNPVIVFRSRQNPLRHQCRRCHGKHVSFRVMLWTLASHCNCPIYFIWWAFLMRYRTRFGKRWGSINNKILLTASYIFSLPPFTKKLAKTHYPFQRMIYINNVPFSSKWRHDISPLLSYTGLFVQVRPLLNTVLVWLKMKYSFITIGNLVYSIAIDCPQS